MIQKYVERFTKKRILPEFVKIGNEYYIPPAAPMKEVGDPFIFGATLGFERGQRYIPSVLLLEMMAPHSKQVVLNEKGAWLLICGRDVFKQSIVKTKGNPKDGDHVVLINEGGEAIGTGKMKAKGVMREYDIGELIRREHKRKTKPRK